jgi:3-methyladenine DNA glycosylase AlkD
MRIDKIKNDLRQHRNQQKADELLRFFKTGPGQYGEGDKFIGVTVPTIRTIAKRYTDIELTEAEAILKSPIHEERFLALVLFVQRFKKSEEKDRRKIYQSYLAHTQYINNWDLVDTSAEHIVGAFLYDKDKKPLFALAKSKSLWERRVAVIATFYFIRRNRFDETLELAHMLLTDREDLIHKAVGWMLREIGKRDMSAEEIFLKKYHPVMPRVMLRYAIEKFPEPKRKEYLKRPVAGK